MTTKATAAPAANPAALQAEIDRLRAQLAKKSTLTLKVSEKGGVSLYGLNARFPVTLYKEQWERVLDNAEPIRKFLADNGHLLKAKG